MKLLPFFLVLIFAIGIASSTSQAQVPTTNGETCTGVIPIGQTATADLHTFTNLGRICGVVVVSSATITAALVEGTGSNCGTGTTALIGTVANPMTLTAGFSAIGGRAWLQTQVPGDHLCLIQTGAGTLAGTITYFDTKMPGR